MKNLIKLVIILCAFNSNAQTNKEAWKFAETIKAEELREHLNILASDEMEGRETGKKGQKMAMDYLIENFKRIGIQDFENRNYVQTFDLIEQKQEGVSLQIAGKDFILNKDFSITPSIIEKRKFTGDIVFVGAGIEEENYNSYEGLDVNNRAVFILNVKPKNANLKGEWSLKERISLAKEKGAAVVIYHNSKLSENLKKYEHYYSKPKLALKEEIKEETIVIAATTELTEAFLKENKLKLKKFTKKGIKADTRVSSSFLLKIDKPTTPLTGENVLAYIPGKLENEEVLVITAHYDHIGKEGDVVFNGADDDGSGTVALLELAEAFQQAVNEGFKPLRSILIMPVSGEEKGLLGSKAYTNNPVFPLENTVANLNIDMIGRLDEAHKENSNYVYLIGSDKLSTDLHEVSEEVNKAHTKIELDYTFNDENDPNRFYYRSDHYNFAKNGIPVIFYFNGVHEDYHKATDTVEKIDFSKMEKITRLVFMTAWEIVNRENRLEVNKEFE